MTPCAENRFDELIWMKAPRPTVTAHDLEVVRLGDRDWIALSTPGHTADHLCMWCPEDGVILTGDHVLPTITPHIGGFLGGDPLRSYLDNLDKVAALDGVTKVLPAHGHPFDDLAARCKAIQDHHARRLEQLVDAAPEAGWAPVPTGRSTSSHRGAGGRWPTARRWRTSSTSAFAGQAERRPIESGHEYHVLT